MYSSLDRVDIVVKPEPDGSQQFVQTDHRTADEIGQTPALSVLFAVVRILLARRSADPGVRPKVLYVAAAMPPEFFRHAISAAGGVLMVDQKPLPATGTAPALQAVVESAVADLAKAVADEFGVAWDVKGVKAVEDALATVAGTREEDEVAYWTAVMKLGSFAGEVIRVLNGGKWLPDEPDGFPFALETPYQGQTANAAIFGKAIKRFDNGDSDSVAFLVHAICSTE